MLIHVPARYSIFSHNQLWIWIWQWKKSISNKFYIAFDVHTTQLSHLVKHLWYQLLTVMSSAEHKQSEWDTVSWCENSPLKYGIIILCMKSNNVCNIMTNCFMLTQVSFWCWFLLLLSNSGNKWQTNSFITTFTTPVHKSFCTYSDDWRYNPSLWLYLEPPIYSAVPL